MSLTPRALATLGIGYGPAMVARIGMWAESIMPTPLPNQGVPKGGGSAGRSTRRKRVEEDEAILIGLLL